MPKGKLSDSQKIQLWFACMALVTEVAKYRRPDNILKMTSEEYDRHLRHLEGKLNVS